MLLGQKLPGAYSGWRFVEGDLYDIAGRVREYDQEARLVREDGSGNLGLAVWQHNHFQVPGGTWTLARIIHDLNTDTPLDGEPDARVIRFMRATDSRRFANIETWNRKVKEATRARELRKDLATEEGFGDHAERYVHAYGKDLGVTKRAFFADRAAA